MPMSRRHFFQATGAGAVGTLLTPYISARGLEAMTFDEKSPLTRAPVAAIRLNSNENPNGCGREALNAITSGTAEANRYPGSTNAMLVDAIANSFGVAKENVALGCGSTEILRSAVFAYCGIGKPLVTASPSFEDPSESARKMGADVRAVPVTGDLTLDLDAMAVAARGAGLVYLCNPNNPTSTVHGGDTLKQFIARVMKDSPSTTILVDEAYHEYVDEPAYASMVPVAMENPRVFVARTFSKVHGMAGLRVGYAVGQQSTIKDLSAHLLSSGVNQLGAFAAIASLAAKDHVRQEQEMNRAARAFAVRGITDLGYKVAVSNANFIMFDVRQNAQPFRDACKTANVLVGRPFPPLHNYARISIGTMDEMQRAMPVFKRALSTAS